jgi:Colicin V production protein
MSIWILAVLLLAILALAGWRQGGILASFSFGGIVFGALLATLIGKIFHPILPHVGASNPITAWAIAPLCGFILVSIIFTAIGFKVNRQVEVFYKHKAGELRHAMWRRLNTRLGICIGLLNGAAYFILVSFVIFNLTYLTTQVAVADGQPFTIRTANTLGHDLQTTGMSRVAAAVGTLPPNYYKFADLSGFLMQNPKTAQRLADYPGFTSLWERDDMQGLVTDGTLTNALASGTTISDILKEQPVQDFLKNKDLTKVVQDAFETNLDDLTTYLQTGKSAKYNDKIIGHWEPNIGVTLAWWRQGEPNVQAKEMAAIRALWTKAYEQTVVIATGDHQLFIKNFPIFKAQPKQAPSVEEQNWKGDWSVDDGTNYTLHANFNGQDKFMSATADDLRMSAKDGKTLLIFDRAD